MSNPKASTITSPTFVLIGQWRWAKGENLAAAKRGFTSRGATLGRGYTILEFDAETAFVGIDEAGRYHYKGNAPTITEVPPKPAKP